MQDKSLFGRFLFSIIFGGALRYSWGIRGVFVGYSWDIRMYRVCVGYVSGMYRESVEGDGARGGRYANHGRARMDMEARRYNERQYRQFAPKSISLGRYSGDGPPTDEHGWTRKHEISVYISAISGKLSPTDGHGFARKQGIKTSYSLRSRDLNYPN